MIRLITFALFCLIPAALFCQVLSFQSYSTKDGLISHDIQTLCQDSKGYLWVGTTDGISVFDGHEFRNYTAADGLPRGFIRQVIEIRENNSSTMWALTQKGSVTRLRDGSFQTFIYDSTARWGHTIRWLGQDHLGTIWAAMEDTLTQIVSDTLKPVLSGMRMGSVSSIFEQGDSLLWFVARSGLFYYSFESKQFNRLSLGRFDEMGIVDCAMDEEGDLWVGLQEGYLIHVRDKKVANERRTPLFDFVVDDRQGSLWFGTYSGLYRISKDRFPTQHVDRFTVDNGLPENTLKCAFVDRENNLWIGGISKGLTRLSEKRIYRFPIDGTIPTYHYSIGAADSNNHIWVISSNGLWEIWEYPSGRWHKVLTGVKEGQGQSKAYPVFYADNVVVKKTLPYSIFIDHLGRLWIGYSNAQLACYRITPGRNVRSQLVLVYTFRPEINLHDAFPTSFIVARDGMVWYGAGNRLALLDPTRRRPLLRVFGERENWPVRTSVRALFEDNRGSIWAGFFNKGVEVLDADSILNGSFHGLSIPQMPSNEKIASMGQDHSGNVWIATETSGLTILDKGIFMTRSTKEGLPSNIVRSVTEDMNGRFWVSTNLGIISFESIRSTFVHRIHDLIGSSVYCSGTTKNGILWFVTSEGLVTYDPTNEAMERMPPPTVITRFQVNDRERPIEPGMILSYDENRCVIDFIAVSFGDEQSIRYQHRLSGVDKDWQPPMRNPSVTYVALEPGIYTFDVKATTAFGGSNGTSATLMFSVVPPFWRTWWFITIAWLSIVGAGAGTARYIEITRLRRKMRVLEQQQALEKERLRISSDLHDELASNLTSIAMLSKILQDDEQRGEARLQRKPELLERIATLSKESVDGIRDIIWAIDPKAETIESLLERIRYMAVVACRARDVRFTYVGSGVDRLPPANLVPDLRRHLWLLLKEAVNNALKHSGCTTISLSTSLQDGTLSITVKDDGRGFDSSIVTQGKGLGTMRSRAEGIGSRLDVITQPGGGTSVTLFVKVQNSMNSRRQP